MKMTRSGFLAVFIMILMFVLLSTTSYAGVKDWFEENALVTALGWIITGVFAVLAIFFGTKVKKWKNVAQGFKDIGVEIYMARKPDSDGGTMITGDEINRILKKAGKFGAAILAAARK